MFRKLLLFCLAASAGLGFASSAQAVVFTLEDFTGDDAAATIEVVQAGDDLNFTATVTSPSVGDIRAIWFNVADDSLITGLSASGTDVTGFGTEADLENDANLSPRSFDFGVLIGGPGDDGLLATAFTLSHSSLALDLDSFFAADAETGDIVGLRLKSTPGQAGSSKLAGGGGTTPVPEPGTLALLGAGLFALGFLRRRTA